MDERTMFVGQSRLPVAWLVLMQGAGTRASFDLGAITSIGRAGWGNEVVLEDPHVSGQHARIRMEGGRHVLYDLGSTNGTWVNGRRVLRMMLMDGDDITLGTTTLRFKEVR